MTAGRTLMVQGSASGVGKSLLVTALCHLLAGEGWRVAPFKAWNMSLNAAVTADGAEIGRAQALQAAAAGIAPTADMNPVLCKPAAGGRVQIILRGRLHATTTYGAGSPAERAVLWRAIRASLAALREQYEVVLIEGAGSPAELNLAGRDIANMRVAALAQAPVLLIGDISRGGVFAALLGTLQLLPPSQRRRVAGLVVNNFHGDPDHFADGAALLQHRAGRPVLGVLPHLPDLGLDEEDGSALWTPPPRRGHPLHVAVVHLPHLANFTDTDVLRYEPDVEVLYTRDPADLAAADLLVLPGSKDTLADLLWLRETGLASTLCTLAGRGQRLLGLCGGYQMLGLSVADPQGLESPLGAQAGLGLLPVETVMRAAKRTRQVAGTALGPPPLPQAPVAGYEIHLGETVRAPGLAPFARLSVRGGQSWEDGAVAPGGRIFGSYLHGLFDNDVWRSALLNTLRAERGLPRPEATTCVAASRAAALSRWAETVRQHLDWPQLLTLAGLPAGGPEGGR